MYDIKEGEEFDWLQQQTGSIARQIEEEVSRLIFEEGKGPDSLHGGMPK